MARTNPIGVRFDPEKLEFIKQREKLKSNQQVVDLLVNKYWWDWKVPEPTYKEAPPLYLKQEVRLPQYTEPEQNVKKAKTKFDFLKAKLDCVSEESYTELLIELNESKLTEREKREIRTA